jgi:Zn-dependent alcohol dehydrogenases
MVVACAWVVDRPGPIGGGPLRPVEAPDPQPGPGEVRVRACGVRRTDLDLVEGDLLPRRPMTVPGHEVVGAVDVLGPGAGRFAVGERVGIAWLRGTCGRCRWCRTGRENLCPGAAFTGWDADGGYAEYAVVPEAFAYRLPGGLGDVEAPPRGHRGLPRLVSRRAAAGWTAGHLRHRHPARQDQLPARPGRRDRLRHGGLSPLTRLTWPSRRSYSRSSTRDSSSATVPTEPAHEPPRRPATPRPQRSTQRRPHHPPHPDPLPPTPTLRLNARPLTTPPTSRVARRLPTRLAERHWSHPTSDVRGVPLSRTRERPVRVLRAGVSGTPPMPWYRPVAVITLTVFASSLPRRRHNDVEE